MLRLRPPLLALTAALLAAGSAAAGPSFDLIVHSNLDEHNGAPAGGGAVGPFHYNDVWGYEAGGESYVIMGLYDGIAVVNVTDPAAPYETGFLPGVASQWRDVKTYGHYAYVTNETSGGLDIFDLSDPENPVELPSYNGISTAHNLYIDTTTGRAYIAGSNINPGGVRILDLAQDPENPVEIGSWEGAYFHDVMVQNGRLYGSAVYAGTLYVLDVSNPFSVSVLGTASGYPDAFTHNAWVTEDDAYVMTTDENSPGRCRMWDLSTLPNLQQTDSYKPNAVTIPHNTHIEGNLAFISFYELGVKVVDISDPFNLVEVAAWDTYPQSDGSEFHGCWGAYPFFTGQPDLIAVTDGESGLWLFSYVGPLGTVAGTVTDADDGSNVAGARVELTPSGVAAETDASGDYSLQYAEGTWDVAISAYGYQDATDQVTIVTGQTTPLNVSLVPLPRAAVIGTVASIQSGLPVAGATVEVVGTPLSTTTDANGDYDLPVVPAGSYDLLVRAFGFTPMQIPIVVTGGVDQIVDFALNPPLAAFDFESGPAGWTVSGNATTGDWELADPQGTSSGGIPVQPEDDHTPSGTLCWVTGAAAGGSLGSGDVDGGATVLESPFFSLDGIQEPVVSYWRWYSTGVGNSTVDSWVVEVSSNGGGSWVDVENTFQTSNAWVRVEVALDTLIQPTNLVKFRFTAQDTGAGSITEAALDDFMIVDGIDEVTGTSVPHFGGPGQGVLLGPARPNPLRPGDEVSFDLALPAAGHVRASLYDVGGRRVAVIADGRLDAGRHRLVWDGRSRVGVASTGVYFLRVETEQGNRARKVLVVR